MLLAIIDIKANIAMKILFNRLLLMFETNTMLLIYLFEIINAICTSYNIYLLYSLKV